MFFADVVIGVARSEGVFTLPLAVYVDDMALIGAWQAEVDRQGVALGVWLEENGVPTKAIKDKPARQVQLALGFYWDSVARTREMEPHKLSAYLAMFRDMRQKRSWTLREMQKVSGRMQRGILTLPQGAMCFLSSLFTAMRGLRFPWQNRRVGKGVKSDMGALMQLLELNMGKGYFAWDHLERAPDVYTDASKESRYAGGGYFSECGRSRWWLYGSNAARSPIDYLEGAAVLTAARDLGHLWRGKLVPLHVDNRAFQLSAAKGWSKAERLTRQIQALFAVAIEYDCVFEFHWISTHDNVLADALSRQDGLDSFYAQVAQLFPAVTVTMHPSSGQVHTFQGEYPFVPDTQRPMPRRALRLSGGGRGTVSRVSASVPYSRASVFVGLPESPAVLEALDRIMDHRLADSSRATVRTAFSHWEVVASRFGWQTVLLSDDPLRGGKLATFVVYLCEETEVSGETVATYAWALRAHMKFARQLDPAMGVVEWDDLMRAVRVYAWMPSEPRRMVPLALVKKALEGVRRDVFWEVQAAVLMLMLLFTFARSETPCPRTLSSFDLHHNLSVGDVDVQAVPAVHARFRLKGIKQDRLIERTSARGNEDWIEVGTASGVLNIIMWMKLLFSFHRSARNPDAPFFVHRDDKAKPLTYPAAMAMVRELLARASDVPTASLYGLHSFRVAGYTLTKRHVSAELAVAQGGWESDAHKRYDGFERLQVLGLPAAIQWGELGDGDAVGTRVEQAVETACQAARVSAVTVHGPAPPAVHTAPVRNLPAAFVGRSQVGAGRLPGDAGTVHAAALAAVQRTLLRVGAGAPAAAAGPAAPVGPGYALGASLGRTALLPGSFVKSVSPAAQREFYQVKVHKLGMRVQGADQVFVVFEERGERGLVPMWVPFLALRACPPVI